MCGNRTGSKLGLIFKTGTGIRSYLFEVTRPTTGFPVPFMCGRIQLLINGRT
jgi:hypothetical protein